MKKYSDNLNKLFKNNDIDLKVKDFIDLEIRLYQIYNLNNEVDASLGWSVYTKYFDVYKEKEEADETKANIFKLRKENHLFSTTTNWKKILKKYLNIEKKYRMFDIIENDKLVKIKPKFEHENREDLYKLHISNISISNIRSNETAQENVKYVSKISKNGLNKRKVYSNDVINLGMPFTDKLDLYKNKKYIKLCSDKDWSKVLEKMGDDFKKRPNINMNILNDKSEIELKDTIHIVGALGSGKSTYKIAQIYEGVKKQNLKIGVIEDTVSNVINTVLTLRKLGINAVAIIGRTNEKNHLKNYLSNKNKLEEIEDDIIISWLSGSCILKSLCEDEENELYPCNKLYENDEKVLCPYFNRCGHMQRIRILPKAEVLVTTPHNLVKGGLNYIDEYDRSVYEIFHDILDMIIVDEADNVQSILDQQLMPSIKINYGENNLLDKFNEIKNDLYKTKRSLEKMNKFKFMNNVNKFEKILFNMERILSKLEKVKKYTINKMWTPKEVFKDINITLQKIEDKNNEKFIKFLSEYVEITDTFNISEDQLNHEINIIFNFISDIHNTDQFNEEKLIEKIKLMIEKYNVKITKETSYELFIQKIAFLILLVQMDYVLKILSSEYPYIVNDLYGNIKYIDGFSNIHKNLRHLLKEPCIGTIYGYKLSYEDGLKIDMIKYSGVGRSLLENWSNAKIDVNIKGPCVICLSGTSYSPGSAHYNLKKNPDILLKGKPEGNIKMKFLPKVYEEKFIQISGISDRWCRINNLKNLTKLLIYDIKYELNFLKESQRKVLLVVNSYEDCKAVGEILSFENINYKLILNEDRNDSVSKDYIESLSTLNIDVCVVPLSIISRGYNILDDNGNSYFGSMFFMIRPYMVPGDFSSYIQILHYYLNKICEEIQNKNEKYSYKVNEFRKKCYVKFNDILEMTYWKKLNPSEKEIMSWFMIVPIKQAIGRMQRNGNDCRVFFCDAAFSYSMIENDKADLNNSILYTWFDMLSKYIDDEIINNLYGNFYIALETVINEINEELDFEEIEE